MKCRHCGTSLQHSFIDLGFSPPSNAYLSVEALARPEIYLPLRVKVCHSCWLVQTEDYARADELFCADYAYFSSTSTGWLRHASQYVSSITERLGLGPNSFVIEVASNDGYLLKYFMSSGIPCLGIEPTVSTAVVAESLGITVVKEFFSEQLANELRSEGRQADLVVGNNVYAHVPDINDFTRGLATLLKPGGVVTLEFPHLVPLIERKQFDTIYHEHFSYLSLTVVCSIFAAAGLRVFDVERLTTHGGSLRVFGCLAEAQFVTTDRVELLLRDENEFGVTRLEPYVTFQVGAERVKDDFLGYLIEQKRAGRKVVAYGAAAKGNTLLNFAGVKKDLISYVCDAAPSKQGKYMPGSHIPILSPQALKEDPPTDVVILPWNIADEVQMQLRGSVGSATRFVIAIPELAVL